jgi:S-methylmethionine-dependent homocysteine/selenocysteine methylase
VVHWCFSTFKLCVKLPRKPLSSSSFSDRFYDMGLGAGAEEKSSSSFMSEFIRKCGGYVVIDGGFATELERHGADLNDPLWSAKCLIDSPHLVRRVRTHILSLSLSLSCCLFLGKYEEQMEGKKEMILK